MAAYESLPGKGSETSTGGRPTVSSDGSSSEVEAANRKAASRLQKERFGWAGLLALVIIAMIIGLSVRGKTDCGRYDAPSAPAVMKSYPYMLGDTSINITVETRAGGPLASLSMINLHTNENTSVVAARALQYYRGGSLTRIHHNPVDRFITFWIGAQNYSFDPNRMFTPYGVKQTLSGAGAYSQAADDAVTAFAGYLLNVYQFSAQQTVIGIHNNGFNYSAAHYLPGAEMASEAQAVYIKPGTNPHNFFFVTDPNVYAIIVAAGLNVVLQSTTTVTDDGSLSYYCFLKNVNYVNVEARAEAGSEGDQIIAQLDMFETFTAAYFNR